jgi:hypothetical protein
MIKNPSRLSRRTLTAALLLLQAGLWAQDLPALAASAIPAAAAPVDGDKKAAQGALLTIQAATQDESGPLSIYVRHVDAGSYTDAAGAQKSGLHADLDISVEDRKDLFSQPSVSEGQTLMVSDHRIRVEQIDPKGRGVVVLRVWSPPKPPAKAKSGWRRFFGL